MGKLPTLGCEFWQEGHWGPRWPRLPQAGPKKHVRVPSLLLGALPAEAGPL